MHSCYTEFFPEVILSVGLCVFLLLRCLDKFTGLCFAVFALLASQVDASALYDCAGGTDFGMAGGRYGNCDACEGITLASLCNLAAAAQ